MKRITHKIYKSFFHKLLWQAGGFAHLFGLTRRPYARLVYSHTRAMRLRRFLRRRGFAPPARRFFPRRALAALAVFALALQVATAGNIDTLAYFLDEGQSDGNALAAGALDIVLNPDAAFAPPAFYPGDEATLNVGLSNLGGLDFNYRVKSGDFSGDLDLCGAIAFSAGDWTGALTDYSTEDIIPAAEPEPLDFKFSLPPGTPINLQNKICDLKLVFLAWPRGEVGPQAGFNDTEEIAVTLQTSAWLVLNEFLPDPPGNDNAPKPAGEWVELYNNTGAVISTAGWYLYDNSDHALAITAVNSDNNRDALDGGETSVPAHGWLVVYRNGSGAFSLNNDQDAVRLYTGILGTGTLVDSYAYNGRDYSVLNPTPGEANDETPLGGSSGAIPVNKSFARIPDGVGAWVDPAPTPGGPNSLMDEFLDSSVFTLVESPAAWFVPEAPASAAEEPPAAAPSEAPSEPQIAREADVADEAQADTSPLTNNEVAKPSDAEFTPSGGGEADPAESARASESAEGEFGTEPPEEEAAEAIVEEQPVVEPAEPPAMEQAPVEAQADAPPSTEAPADAAPPAETLTVE